MTVSEPTVVVVGTGHESKRRYYERLAELGARMVIVEEPGHWSESLAEQIAGARWVPVPFSGDPDADAAAILDALVAAPTLRPALDLSHPAPGAQVPPGETAVVDDPHWAQA